MCPLGGWPQEWFAKQFDSSSGSLWEGKNFILYCWVCVVLLIWWIHLLFITFSFFWDFNIVAIIFSFPFLPLNECSLSYSRPLFSPLIVSTCIICLCLHTHTHTHTHTADILLNITYFIYTMLSVCMSSRLHIWYWKTTSCITPLGSNFSCSQSSSATRSSLCRVEALQVFPCPPWHVYCAFTFLKSFPRINIVSNLPFVN